tara:strand:+ start:1356 stop:1604 length:249 start_codon:yes stop_codon:yes gene_type:complete
MAQATYELDIPIGFMGEQLISFEVEYRLDSTNGDVIIEDFYAEAVLFDANGWRSVEKVSTWLYELLKAEVEDYKYDMIQQTA